MKSRLILTLKLVVVAALFVVIFYSIEWHDSFKRVDAQGEVSATVEGDIVGPWDGDTVQFRIAPDSEVLTLQRTADEQGTSIQVSPGFFTYFKHLEIQLVLCKYCEGHPCQSLERRYAFWNITASDILH